MNGDVLGDVQRRLGDLNRTSARFRSGEITDTSPLSVALGGSDVPYVDVRSIASGVALGARVAVLVFGNDLLVLGTITDSVDVYGVTIPAASGWTSSATFSRIGRLVVLQGSFSKTSGTPASGNVMGTLPADASPPVQMDVSVATQNNDVNGTILIQAAGNLVWRTGSTSETDGTAIDGIAFVV